MCGITGIIDFSQASPPEVLRAWVADMNQRMHHRGPDDTAYWDHDVAHLGFKRLSIIDLTTGNQPIFNEDRTVCVILNGEIYNYVELREELLQKGHTFYTHSDTETLVHLYEEQGMDMLASLKGMFAFCLYDISKQTAYFARDRFGEKPFFYWYRDGFFAFASELNALLGCPRIPRRLNHEALPYFLKMGMVPEPITLFDEVGNLPPGNFMVLNQQGLHTEPYFRVDYRPDPAIRTLDDAKASLEPFLKQAIRRQMRTDVPLGAFLSGGIDSSTVAALLQQHSAQKIKTFTVRFEESTYDESPIARKVAQHIGSDHHEITLPNEGFGEEIFWNILDHTGLPFSDTSAIPTYHISREIRRYVTVALSGDGGDELFAGYPIFDWWQRIHRLKALPVALRAGAGSLLKMAGKAPGLKGISAIRQVRKALEFSAFPSERLPMEIMEAFDRAFLDKTWKREPDLSRFTDFWQQASGWTPLRQIMYFRLRYNLPLNLLPKVDRMSMAHSIEVRAPFLDPDLFEASARIPDHFLLHRGTGKYIIRELMKDHLPREVFEHPKMGFAIPLHRYMNEAYRELAERLIQKDRPLARLFDWEEVERTRQVGLYARKDTASLSVFKAGIRLWMLLALFGWAERYQVEI